jgi:hypothetical protein
MTASLMPLHANLFQLFQPIGGVRATPLSKPRAGAGARNAIPSARNNIDEHFSMRLIYILQNRDICT